MPREVGRAGTERGGAPKAGGVVLQGVLRYGTGCRPVCLAPIATATRHDRPLVPAGSSSRLPRAPSFFDERVHDGPGIGQGVSANQPLDPTAASDAAGQHDRLLLQEMPVNPVSPSPHTHRCGNPTPDRPAPATGSLRAAAGSLGCLLVAAWLHCGRQQPGIQRCRLMVLLALEQHWTKFPAGGRADGHTCTRGRLRLWLTPRGRRGWPCGIDEGALDKGMPEPRLTAEPQLAVTHPQLPPQPELKNPQTPCGRSAIRPCPSRAAIRWPRDGYCVANPTSL